MSQMLFSSVISTLNVPEECLPDDRLDSLDRLDPPLDPPFDQQLSHQHLNRDYLKELSDGCSDFEQELLQVFVDDGLLQLAQLAQAIVDRDPQEIQRIAHRLKGSSANIGAQVMAQVAEQMERHAQSLSLSALETGMKQLEQSLTYIQHLI